jgi:Nop14-like family
MGKGSQLSQLKSALSQAGLSKQSQQPRRKRGRAQNEEKDNAKRAARLLEIQQKLNPFDVKVTKLKHEVGGRKLRGVSGKPAQSKQAGIEAVRCPLSVVHASQPFLSNPSGNKLFSKSSKRRIAPAESLTDVSEKMIPLSHRKNVCLNVSRGRGSVPPRGLHSVSMMKLI